MNSRKCEVGNFDVHRATYAKHLRSNYHFEKEKQIELILPEWLFQEPIENEIINLMKLKIYKPKPLKHIARAQIKLDDKQLNKESAKEMISPYYFTDRNLKVGFKINLDTHHINLAISKLTITPTYPEFGIEVRYLNEIMKELSVIYARLIKIILNSNIKQNFQHYLINKMKIIKF